MVESQNSGDELADHNLNIFHLLEIAWKEKWLLFISIIGATGISLIAGQLSETRTVLRFDYVLNFPGMDQLPGATARPVRKNSFIEDILKDNLSGSWKVKGASFSSLNSPIDSEKAFKEKADLAVEKVDDFVLEESKRFLSVIDRQEAKKDSSKSNVLANQGLIVASLVDSLSAERHNSIKIENLTLVRPSTSPLKTIAAGIMMGLGLGVVLIMLKRSYATYKLSKTY